MLQNPPSAAQHQEGPGHGIGSLGHSPGLGLPSFSNSPPGATHLPPHDPIFGAIPSAPPAPPSHGLHPHHQMHHPHLPPPPHHIPAEPPKPRFLFRMPRVVPNQKEKFESDELMKRHSREGEVRFTAFRDRPLQERQAKFIASLREGHVEMAFIATGFNLILSFNPAHSFDPRLKQMDFEKEPGKVHIRSPMILNGVCIRWKGYIDMERLDGVGCIEFDEETAKVEDAILREQVEAYNRRMKDFEEHRKQQQRQLAAFMGQQQAAIAAAAAAAAAATAASSSTTSPSLSSTQLAEATSTSPPSISSSTSLSNTTSTTSSSVSSSTNSNSLSQISHSLVDNISSSNSNGLIHPDLLETSPSPTTMSSCKEQQHLELSATLVSNQP